MDVVYLGVRVFIRTGTLHTTLFDREEDYSLHIVRYPEWETAPRPHLVLTGRFLACQRACLGLGMQDLKESVANVIRHAL